MTLCDQLAEIGAESYMLKTARDPVRNRNLNNAKRQYLVDNAQRLEQRNWQLNSPGTYGTTVASPASDAQAEKTLSALAKSRGEKSYMLSRLLGWTKDTAGNVVDNTKRMVNGGIEALDNASIKARNVIDNATGAVGKAGGKALTATANGMNAVTEVASRGGSYVKGAVGRMRVPKSAAVNTARTVATRTIPHNPYALAVMAAMGVPAVAGGAYMLSGSRNR